MPKFLVQATYTSEGVTGLQRDGGSGRRDAVASAVEGLGGQLESFHFGFGKHDAYVIVELPDNETAAALALAVNAAGSVTSQTTVLLTPEEVDAAAERSVSYRAPGA
jgi:uncharacterized protein with GYD domain